MMEKFSCFYQFLDKKGISLSAGGGPASPPVRPVTPSDASVLGKYIRKDKSSDYIELDPDGTFSLQQSGKPYAGNYTVQADAITIQVTNASVYRLHLSGNAMVGSDGTVWEKQGEPQKASVDGPKSDQTQPASQEKQAEPQKAPGAPVTIDQIIQMAGAKLPDDIIITTIRNSGSKFDLTPDALIKLKTAGVSDEVIRAMTRTN
jgi:hypothetical protein